MKKVFCIGTFDILHSGHINFLKDAKEQGDYLLIIVVPDRAVRENKGRNPKNNQKNRIKNLKKINVVNEVLSTDGVETTLRLLSKIEPNIFALGYDQNTSVISKIIKGIDKLGLKMSFYKSKEFAEGIHTSDLY